MRCNVREASSQEKGSAGSTTAIGVQTAIRAAHLCQTHGNLRCLERVYAIQQYLDRLSRFAGQESGILRDALYGPIGQWNMQS